MADDDISEQVRNIMRTRIAQMRDRNVPKDDAVRISGQPYEVVDSIYNAGKSEEKELKRQVRDRNERGE